MINITTKIFAISVITAFYSCSIFANDMEDDALTPLTEEQMHLLQQVDLIASMIICKTQRVPNGHVIVSEETSANCRSGPNNAWRIKKPGVIENICKRTPIPQDYVIVAETVIDNCPIIFGRLNNGWTIRQPRPREVICSISPIPDNYYSIGTATTTACPPGIRDRDNAKIIRVM